VALAPWLMFPGLVVILAVLVFNLIGDGLARRRGPVWALTGRQDKRAKGSYATEVLSCRVPALVENTSDGNERSGRSNGGERQRGSR